MGHLDHRWALRLLVTLLWYHGCWWQLESGRIRELSPTRGRMEWKDFNTERDKQGILGCGQWMKNRKRKVVSSMECGRDQCSFSSIEFEASVSSPRWTPQKLPEVSICHPQQLALGWLCQLKSHLPIKENSENTKGEDQRNSHVRDH
jgi:hypothetical protein